MKQFKHEASKNDPLQMRKWNDNLEDLFQHHKSEIRLGLTKVYFLNLFFSLQQQVHGIKSF